MQDNKTENLEKEIELLEDEIINLKRKNDELQHTIQILKKDLSKKHSPYDLNPSMSVSMLADYERYLLNKK